MAWTIEATGAGPAPANDVFAILADPATWSRWGHNAVWARSDGPLVEGGVVEVRANYGKTYRCRILLFVPGRALVLEARPPLMTVTQTYEVEPTPGGGARLRHAITVAAPFAGVMRRLGFPGAYRRQLADEVREVLAMASATGA